MPPAGSRSAEKATLSRAQVTLGEGSPACGQPCFPGPHELLSLSTLYLSHPAGQAQRPGPTRAQSSVLTVRPATGQTGPGEVEVEGGPTGLSPRTRPPLTSGHAGGGLGTASSHWEGAEAAGPGPSDSQGSLGGRTEPGHPGVHGPSCKAAGQAPPSLGSLRGAVAALGWQQGLPPGSPPIHLA